MSELFVIETDRVRLAWSGPRASGAGRLRVEGLRTGAALLVDAPDVEVGGGAATGSVRLEEEARYAVLVQSRSGAPVELRHRDPALTSGLEAGDGGRVVHGRLTFGSQVGTSRFVVAVGGVPEVAFEVAVAPVKAAPSDVAAMRRDVEASAAGLGAAFLRATATGAARDARQRPGRPVWAALLREAIAALEAALAEIGLRPREDAARTPALVRAERISRPDPSVVAALRRRGVAPGAVVPARPFHPSLDTPAHRWLRARLDAARRRVATIRREEMAGRPGPRRARTLDELGAAEALLTRFIARSPLAEATPDRPTPAPPLLLRRAPGYADAYAALAALDVALDLGGGRLRATPLDLAALYEAWAVLTVVRVAGEVLGVAPEPALVAAARGVALTLRSGHKAAARLRAPDGTVVHVAHAPRLDAAPALLAQRPDLLLTVARPGAPPRLFVLDAKYRRDDSAAYRRRHGAPGPPEDALGVLHRYRDAIVRAGPRGPAGAGPAVERPVEAAAALFPYREAAPGAFEKTRLWRGLGEIGVGAIPLLPGETGYLDRWLRTIL